MTREFSLENENGQQYSMMSLENGCFLNSPRRLRVFI